jgi:hypothetical protein
MWYQTDSQSQTGNTSLEIKIPLPPHYNQITFSTIVTINSNRKVMRSAASRPMSSLVATTVLGRTLEVF